jgi:acetylglutamate kinase
LTAIERSALVVKFGGEVIDDPCLADLATDLVALAQEGRRPVLVHGGGPQATRLQKALGQAPRQIAGRRYTDEATLDVMKMVVAGKLNVDLCAALIAAGGRPVGLHGASASVILATKRPPRVYGGAGPDPIDLGLVGDVVAVNRELIELLLDHGYTPVLACLGVDSEGHALNINADIVANHVAKALSASGLILVSDVAGVLRDVHDPGSRIERLTIAEGRALIEQGVVTRGMIPKLEESFAAIADGVRRVHIVGKLGRGDLLREARSPGSVGTVLEP